MASLCSRRSKFAPSRFPHMPFDATSSCLIVLGSNDTSVMKEALQNHTPQTIAVDEVSNRLEARACLDIKAR